MRSIKKYVDQIEEELEGAKEYAENYLHLKAMKGDQAWVARYKEMANDELKHSTYLHELVVKEIGDLGKDFTAPQAMQERWSEAHRKFVEDAALVKQMLSA